MGNFFDKFKYFIGIEEYDEEYDEEIDDNEFQDNTISEDSDTKLIEDKNDSFTYNKDRQEFEKKEERVINMKNNTNMKIVIHEPKSYEEAPKIVNDLKDGKVIVVNFESLEVELKKQIFEFVNGALYTMEGKIQKVTTDIFIVAPKSVYIDGLKDELKNKGVITWD